MPNQRRRLWIAGLAIVAVAGVTSAAVVVRASNPPGCGTVDFKIKESQEFTPFGVQRTPPVDPVINPAGAPSGDIPADARVSSLDSKPFAWGVAYESGAAYQYFSDSPIDSTVTLSQFLSKGGVELDRDPVEDPNVSFVEYLLAQLGERAVSVQVGAYEGALSWADPDSHGLRPHVLTWTDGKWNFALTAVRSPEALLGLARDLVCGDNIGTTAIGSAAAAALASGSDDRPRIGGWPEDVNGDGVISDRDDERIPELIRAVGDSGVEGFVRFDDVEGPQPSSPEEAARVSGADRVIPVYAEDGKTVVDEYTLSGGDPPPVPSPTPTLAPAT